MKKNYAKTGGGKTTTREGFKQIILKNFMLFFVFNLNP